MGKFIRLLFIFLFASCINAYSQDGTIKGFVYDDSNGEGLGYCIVQLKGTSYGAVTEKSGGFIISKIPKGDYVLTVTFFGYDTLSEPVKIEGGVISKRYQLKPSKISLDAVQVTAAEQRVITETRTSVISITPKEMKKMPAIGGQPDFAQYLQVLPGIVSTGDQGGQLYIRGGTPIQNMVLLDGMLVSNPFHSIGFFSVFDSDIISDADVYTGGFGAEFGGRISSVMDIHTKDGNRKRTSGKIDISTVASKFFIEGPIVKLKENRKVSLSYLLSFKGSYLQQSSKWFYKYVGEEGLPYNFFDFYGKLSLASTNGSKLNIFGFNFDDKVDYRDIATYKWKNYGVGTNFLLSLGKVPINIEGTIAYSNYGIKLDDKLKDGVDSSTLSGFTADINFSYYFGKSVFKIGAALIGYRTTYSFFPTPYNKIFTSDNTSDIGIYLKYKYNYRNKLLIEPSFRLQYYASMGVAYPEPRLSIKYNITQKIRLKFAAGLYSQNYVAATSDRDVVNLFYGFLSSPSDLPKTFDGETVKNNLQKAQHIVFGFEIDLIPYTTINIEGYFKNFSLLTSLNRYKIYDDNEVYASKPEMLRKDYIFEKGRAYGGDFTAKFEYKGFYLWFVYSLGWVTRFDGVVNYSPHFDRRHNINLVASYACGKRKSWQFDLRWNFGSGFPYTQNQGYYPQYIPSDGIGDDYVSANENISFFLADLNAARLPSYHRLDLNIKKKFFIGEHNVIELNVGATNLYNQKNIFYVNRISNAIIYQLPILYSFGLNWSF
ncbi:MAG: TonB-dependent receptor [Bacteroidales bacterium]|nr:TonB-dependent receptor [Bacteroidales bacterium]